MSNEKVVIYGEIMPLPKVRGSLLPNTIASSGDDYLEIKSEIINARLGSDGEKFDSVGEHIRAVNDKIGGQPNFIANEGEEGYILNRTHYVDKEGVVHKLDNKFVDADWMATSKEHIATTVVYPEQTVSSGLIQNRQFNLNPDIMYDVYVNGAVYACRCYNEDGAYVLGDSTYKNYPFYLFDYGGTSTGGFFMYDSNVISSPVKVKVTEHSYTEYNKLPEGFLPECVVKSVNGEKPDENGNVEIEAGSGLSYTEKTLLLSLFKNAAYTADMSATIAQLETLWSETPDTPEDGVEQIGSVLSIVSGVTVNQIGSILTIA